MKLLLSIFTSALLLFYSSTLPLLVHSEDSDFAGVVSQDPQYAALNDIRPSNLVSGTINLILGGAGVVAFLYLLYGGIQWIMAGGDKEGVEKARKKITAALIGVSVVFSSYAFIFVVQALFGIDILRVDIQYIENTNYSSGNTGGGPPASCGDGSCNGGETCSTCSPDCGVCTPPPGGTCTVTGACVTGPCAPGGATSSQCRCWGPMSGCNPYDYNAYCVDSTCP